jgi:hypothetical protein
MNKLSEVTLSKLNDIRTKILPETSVEVFTPYEIMVMEQAYIEITGKKPFNNCRVMCEMTLRIVKNYLKANPLVTEIEYEVLEPVSESTEEVVYQNSEPDYNSMTLAKLREMFPNIKSNSKAKFIELING